MMQFDVDHLPFSGGSKVIHGIIACKEREPGDEAKMYIVIHVHSVQV